LTNEKVQIIVIQLNKNNMNRITIRVDLCAIGVTQSAKLLQEAGCKIISYDVSTVGERAWFIVDKMPLQIPEFMELLDNYETYEELHKRCLGNVSKNPTPQDQKFRIGEKVMILANSTLARSEYKGMYATVEYTYAHYTNSNDRGGNFQEFGHSYRLNIENHGSVGWFYECDLRKIK